MTNEQKILKDLISTIDATGGLIHFEDGTYGCCGDEEWIDLADVALQAHHALTIAGINVTLRIQDENGNSEGN